jgi:hypothetical protein
LVLVEILLVMVFGLAALLEYQVKAGEATSVVVAVGVLYRDLEDCLEAMAQVPVELQRSQRVQLAPTERLA